MIDETPTERREETSRRIESSADAQRRVSSSFEGDKRRESFAEAIALYRTIGAFMRRFIHRYLKEGINELTNRRHHFDETPQISHTRRPFGKLLRRFGGERDAALSLDESVGEFRLVGVLGSVVEVGRDGAGC